MKPSKTKIQKFKAVQNKVHDVPIFGTDSGLQEQSGFPLCLLFSSKRNTGQDTMNIIMSQGFLRR